MLRDLCQEDALRTSQLLLEEWGAGIGAQARDWAYLEHLELVEDLAYYEQGFCEFELIQYGEGVLPCPLGEELFEGGV
jgi:hypothetical protein